MIGPVKLAIRLVLYTLLCAVYFSSSSHAQWSQQSCSFPHRTPVTVTAGGFGHSDETRIDLSSSDFPASYVFSANGDDVRVFESDDTATVDFMISDWNTVAETTTIFVRLPAMASGTSETIYIYVGDGVYLAAVTQRLYSLRLCGLYLCPSTPTDATLTYMRYRSSGVLSPNDAGDMPSFTTSFRAEVE